MRTSLLGGLVGYEKVFSIIISSLIVPQNPHWRIPGSGPSDTSHHRRNRTTTLRVLLPFLQTRPSEREQSGVKNCDASKSSNKFARTEWLFFKQLRQPGQVGGPRGSFKGRTSAQPPKMATRRPRHDPCHHDLIKSRERHPTRRHLTRRSSHTLPFFFFENHAGFFFLARPHDASHG